MNNPLRFVDPNGKDQIDPSILQELTDFDQIAHQRANALIALTNNPANGPFLMSQHMSDVLKQIQSGTPGGIDNLVTMEEDTLSHQIEAQIRSWISNPKTTLEDLKAADWDIREQINKVETNYTRYLRFALPKWIKPFAKPVDEVTLEFLDAMLGAAIKQKEDEEKAKQKHIDELFEDMMNGGPTLHLELPGLFETATGPSIQ